MTTFLIDWRIMKVRGQKSGNKLRVKSRNLWWVLELEVPFQVWENNLKEKNPNIKIIGIEYLRVGFLKNTMKQDFDEAEIYPYVTKELVRIFYRKNVDFDIIDHFEKVTDKEAAIMTPRIAKEEGIFVGNSAGSAVQGLIQMKLMFKKRTWW